MAKKKCLENTNGISRHFFQFTTRKRDRNQSQPIKQALLLQPLLRLFVCQVFAVGGNDLFVPVKGLLLQPLQRSMTLVVPVHINEAIPL